MGDIDNLTEWKALNNIDFLAIPDTTFTREKTGAGDIEYFNSEHPEGITYNNGYHRNHPMPGKDVILYNPNRNDNQDIRLDALHIMPKDPTYDTLNALYRNEARGGDPGYWGRQHYLEDAKKYGKNNIDPEEQYFNNEADGLLRNMFIEGSPEYIESKRYRSDKDNLERENNYLLPYINNIRNYLETGERPQYIQTSEGLGYLFPELIVTPLGSYFELLNVRAKGGPISDYSNLYKDGRLYWGVDDDYTKDILDKLDKEDRINEYKRIEEVARSSGNWLKMKDGTTWQGNPRTWVHMLSKYYKLEEPSDIVDFSYLEEQDRFRRRYLYQLNLANMFAKEGKIQPSNIFGEGGMTFVPSDFSEYALHPLTYKGIEYGDLPHKTKLMLVGDRKVNVFDEAGQMNVMRNFNDIFDTDKILRMMNGYIAYLDGNAYQTDSKRLEFKDLGKDYEPKYSINGLDIYSVPGSELVNYLLPTPEGAEYSEGLWGNKNFNEESNYYMVRNPLFGGYSPIPKGGSISNLIDFYLDSPISPKIYEDRALDMMNLYLQEVEVRALQSRDNYINWMLSLGYKPWQITAPDLDYYKYINDGIGDINQLRERYPNNILLGNAEPSYRVELDLLWDLDAVERARNQLNLVQSAFLVSPGYLDMIRSYSPYTQQYEIDNAYNGAKGLSDIVNTSLVVTGAIQSPVKFGLSLAGAYGGKYVGDKATDLVVKATTDYNNWNELAKDKWGWGEADANASNPGGAILGLTGMLYAPKLTEIPGLYYTSYLTHPTWKTYYHGSPHEFPITNANMGGEVDFGLHAAGSNNYGIARGKAGAGGTVYKFRAPRPNATTIDIHDNNWRLLDSQFNVEAHPHIADWSNRITSYPGDKLRFNLIKDAGGNPSWGESGGLFNENEVTINLLNLFKGLQGSFKLRADDIVSRGRLLESDYAANRISLNDYYTLSNLLNEESANLLSEAGHKVIRYNNVYEGTPYIGSRGWYRPNYSYTITDPSIIDVLPNFKLNWKPIVPMGIPQLLLKTLGK